MSVWLPSLLDLGIHLALFKGVYAPKARGIFIGQRPHLGGARECDGSDIDRTLHLAVPLAGMSMVSLSSPPAEGSPADRIVDSPRLIDGSFVSQIGEDVDDGFGG